jgi:biopolymer transport protein ExbB
MMTAPPILTPLAFAAVPSLQAACSAFLRGGAVMWPLLGCSLLTLTIGIERALVFSRVNARRKAGQATADRILKLTATGQFDEAVSVADRGADAVCRVLAAGLRQRDYGLSDSLQAAADKELDHLRGGLSLLDTMVTLGPLLGILGTGIIRSFHLLSSSGIEDPTAVTGGIAEALITTAAGLIVAILALIPFNYFVAQVRRLARDLEQNGHRLEIAYSRGLTHASADRL